jgi:hypothetical protein
MMIPLNLSYIEKNACAECLDVFYWGFVVCRMTLVRHNIPEGPKYMT